MAALPTRMTAIGIKSPGGPDMLVPEERPVPTARRRRNPGQGRGRRRQPARRDAAPGPLPAAARRARYSGPRDRRRGRGARARASSAGKSATGSWRWWSAAAMPNIASRTRATRCRSTALDGGSRRPCRRPSSPSGTTCSSAARSKPARRCWCMAAPPASAPPPSSSPRRSARASSSPPARTKNARPAASSAPTSPSTTRREDFVAATKDATGGKGADVILDMVGGDYIERNYEAAAVEGRIVQIAFQGGAQGEGQFPAPDAQAPAPHRLDAARALGRRQGAPSPARSSSNVLPLIEAGKVKPVIYKTFPLREAASAHALMESSAHIGKIVLTV